MTRRDPRRLSPAALATIRLYSEAPSVETAGQVLSVLVREPAVTGALRERFERAARAARELADLALAMVRTSDETKLGDAVEQTPEPSNDICDVYQK